jgi:hypothetical protein
MDSGRKNSLEKFYAEISAARGSAGKFSDPPGLLLLAGGPEILAAAKNEGPGTVVFLLAPQGAPAAGRGIVSCVMSAADFFTDKVSIAASLFEPDRIRFSVTDAVRESFPAETAAVHEEIQTALSNRTVDRDGSLLRFRNGLLNMARVFEGKAFEAEFAGPPPPAVICGAGPSLTQSLGIIREWSSKVLVISAGRALKVLSAAGIRADFAVEVDPECGINWRSLDLEPDCPLAAGADCDPSVTARFPKIIFRAPGSAGLKNFLADTGLDFPGIYYSRTVSASAVDFAVSLGCGSIALAGNDLCLADDGRSHASERPKPAVETFSAAGKDGGEVLTTQNFRTLALGMERFLAELSPAKPGVKVFNCSARGAAIKGAPSLGLAEFMLRFAGAEKILSLRPLLTGAERPRAALRSARDAAEKILTGPDKAAAAAELMLKELSCRGGPDPGRLARLQDGLRAAVSDEDRTFGAAPLRHAALTATRAAGELTAESSAARAAAANDASAQIRIFLAGRKLARGILSDFKRDMDAVVSGEETPGKARKGFVRFNSFKETALDFVSRSNPEYAEALAKDIFGPAQERFIVVPDWQRLPWASLKTPDGASLPLSGFEDIDSAARRAVDSFVSETGLGGKGNAVVFLSPGNFAYAAEFAKRYPDSPVITADPWPELFNEIVQRCLLTRFFREDTVLVGAHEKLPGWRKTLSAALARAKRAGHKILFFDKAPSWPLPETAALLETARRVL